MALNATLYNKRRPVMDVRLDKAGRIIELGDVHDPMYLPLILQYKPVDLVSVNKWLDKRKMPANREGLREARRKFGPFENYRNMFSLTDQYWFKRSKNESWDELNFFTHQYPTAVGDALFAPWTVDKKQLSLQSPDLTTNGVCRKQWVQDDQMNSYLIKAASKQFHQEPLSEILASMTLQKLNIIPFVKYEFVINGLRICSKSKCFVTKDFEFVPAQHIYQKEPRLSTDTIYDHFIKMCDKFDIPEAREFVDSMILADYVIGNSDRHLGNFGVLKDVTTGEIVGFAPLFDFGSAFWEYNEDAVKQPKSRMFADQENRVFKHFIEFVSMKELSDTDEIFSVIDMYPDLSVEQKNAIKKGIEERAKKFKLSEKYRTERSR